MRSPKNGQRFLRPGPIDELPLAEMLGYCYTAAFEVVSCIKVSNRTNYCFMSKGNG